MACPVQVAIRQAEASERHAAAHEGILATLARVESLLAPATPAEARDLAVTLAGDDKAKVDAIAAAVADLPAVKAALAELGERLKAVESIRPEFAKLAEDLTAAHREATAPKAPSKAK